MLLKKYLGKTLNVSQLRQDMKDGEITGAHYFEKGQLDDSYDIVEFVVFNHAGYAFAFDIFIDNQVIVKIERVKFQWECGGWRSKNIVIKRFPIIFYKVEEPAEAALNRYCE